LANAYLALEDWTSAAASYQGLLNADPTDRDAYTAARFLYHEKLFQFDQAFALDQHWLEQHPEDLDAQADFAEAHFTTGRFADAHVRLVALVSQPALPPPVKVALHALDIAALLALTKLQDVPASLTTLHDLVTAHPGDAIGGWLFAGTRYFIRQQKHWATYPWLDALLAAIQGNDRAALLAAIEQAQGVFPSADLSHPAHASTRP
jgi:tetratricopeptide (TPR) repeat protein